MTRFTAYLVLAAVLFLGCRSTVERPYPEIHHAGNLREIMKGNTAGVIRPDSLRTLEHLYGLGVMEHLDGELIIMDSKSTISYVAEDSVMLKSTWVQPAALLVYTQVVSWNETTLPLSVSNMESFIGYLEYDGEDNELLNSGPRIFILEGRIKELEWHLMKKADHKDDHGQINHDEMSVPRTLASTDVEILAFYSKDHEGIYTHHGLPTHMHFITKDGQLAGHVDDFDFEDAIVLKTPEIKK